MNFEYTEEQIMIRDAARDFAERELLPDVLKGIRKQDFLKDKQKLLLSWALWV